MCRSRQLILRDTRDLGTPLHSMELDVSAGILVPLYDPDTKMVFLTGKGDRYIQFVEVIQCCLRGKIIFDFASKYFFHHFCFCLE